MSLAVVFSGQGTQHPAMLPWLADSPLLQTMAALLDAPDWRACMAAPGWGVVNAHAQPLLTATALAAWQQIAPALPRPLCVAGYSVGELAAFAAAGVFDADTALQLAVRRAAAMDRCALRRPGGLLAVGGLHGSAIDALCRDTGLAVAIRNGPDSAVLGGTRDAIDAGEPRALAAGARTTRLCVGVASHTPLMQGAADEFAALLHGLPLARPQLPLFSNAAGRVDSAAAAGDALAAQIGRTVRWDACMDDIRARRPSCVLEVGPGRALARLWNQHHPDVPARSCDEFRQAASIVRWVEACSTADAR